MIPALLMFKLRSNITLDGDLFLAKMELESFPIESLCVMSAKDVSAQTPELCRFEGLSAVDAHTRKNHQQFFQGQGFLETLPDLIGRLSFVQHIYGKTPCTSHTEKFLKQLQHSFRHFLSYEMENGDFIIQALPHYALIEYSEVVVRQSSNAEQVKDDLQKLPAALLNRPAESRTVKLAEKALNAQSTTAHLSHDVHYYKAKFFPRMVRALLNRSVSRLNRANPRILDNFAGSGTTLLEASLPGFESVGLDIDPLSVLIARVKLEALHLDSGLLQDEFEKAITLLGNASINDLPLFRGQATASMIPFPGWLLKNRRMTSEMAGRLANEMVIVQNVVASSDVRVRDLFRVLLSDAITRRIRMRFLGTGVGRFSLIFSSETLPVLFARSLQHYVKVVAAIEWLRDTLELHLAPAQVFKTDARSASEVTGLFDILVASPPYLPASSGRESYARARTPSLIALKMADIAEADTLADEAIGSMSQTPVDLSGLTAREMETIQWLRQDNLRGIKAEPVARYFLDMRQSFQTMYRLLSPGALAVMVSGKQSTFYRFSTREVLHTAYTAEMLAEEAASAGFEVEALQDIQLMKSNANARPRSLDDYYETLIFLRRPEY